MQGVFGHYDGGANSSKQGVDNMIILPITQLQVILSMVIGEIFLLSDPHYTVSIGSENYFSLAVGAFLGGIFIFTLIAIKIDGRIQFKESRTKQKPLMTIKQN